MKKANSSTALHNAAILRGTTAELGRLIRRHWAVVNELRWWLVVALREDVNKTAARHAGANPGLVRRVAAPRHSSPRRRPAAKGCRGPRADS